MSRHYIIPIFVPHLGCPHDCVFCNQKRITGIPTDINGEKVEEIITNHLKTFKENSTIEVAFYGGSFTGIDLQIQQQLLSIPLRFKKEKKIHYIRLSTRPDYIDERILDNLREYGVDTIELGIQSLDEEVLFKSGRGHNNKDTFKAIELIKRYGFNLGLQMMIGLPGDNMEKSIKTCKEFIKQDPFCVRIYPTLVIKDTYLETLYQANRYNPLSLEKSVDISSIILMLFNQSDINVIRVGLQPTDNIQLGKDVVAGPFHPAYRQVVEANIFRNLFEYYLNNKGLVLQGKSLIIEGNSKQISIIVGQKSANTNYFKNKYGFKQIKILQRDMDSDYIQITIEDFYDKINMKSLTESYLVNRVGA